MKEKRHCEFCSNEFEAELFECCGKMKGATLCSRCSGTDLDELKKRAIERSLKSWNDICPPLYKETDINRLPSEKYEEIMKWEYNPIGIGAIGKTGTSKTRCMWQLLKKVCGYKFISYSATEFAHQCGLLYSKDLEKAEKWMDELCHCEILFFDDIGKDRATERVATELYYVVEYRTSHKLPILWTTNFVGSNLEEKLGESGAATVRRLREFSKIVSFT